VPSISQGCVVLEAAVWVAFNDPSQHDLLNGLLRRGKERLSTSPKCWTIEELIDWRELTLPSTKEGWGIHEASKIAIQHRIDFTQVNNMLTQMRALAFDGPELQKKRNRLRQHHPASELENKILAEAKKLGIS
jgi:hypothetical protein